LEYDPVPAIKRAARLFARVQADIDRSVPRSAHAPSERRVLLELLANPASVSAEVRRALAMEGALLSRTIKQLISEGLVAAVPTSSHRSQKSLSLTPDGERVACILDRELSETIRDSYLKMSRADRDLILTASGAAVNDMLNKDREKRGPITISKPSVRDLTVLLTAVIRYGHEQYQWVEPFVSSVSETLHEYIDRRISDFQMGWIAHRGGRLVGGCLLVASEDAFDAKIGLLYVIPNVRRRSVGTQLLAFAVEQAREMDLSSVSAVACERQPDLDAAYRKAGFTRSKRKETDYRFGTQDTWRTYEIKFPLSI